MRQTLTSGWRTWHITFGTHGARLHGDGRPTVDRSHNERGEAFIYEDRERADRERDRLRGGVVYLNEAHRRFIESVIPGICQRGKWVYRVCAAPGPPDEDHVHVLLDADRAMDPKAIRMWLKRWAGEAMSDAFPRPPGGQWWAEGGSTKPVTDEAYLNRAFGYIKRQRTTREEP